MKMKICLAAAGMCLAVIGQTYAQTPPKPVNWIQQVGSMAVDPDQIRTLLPQVPLAERADFTRRVLKAIGSMPVSPDEKAQRMTRAAVALVAASGDAKRDVVGSIFANCPLLYLGAVSQALSAGFDQKKNGLSNEAYLTIATNLMSGIVEQIALAGKALVGTGLSDAAQTDDIVRYTVAVATLVRSAGDPAAVEAALLAYIPGESRASVASVLAAAIKGDYGPLMDVVGNDARMVLPVTFAPAVLQFALLSQIDIRRSADESRFVSVGIERQWGNERLLPLIPLPVGYQNQGLPDFFRNRGGWPDRLSDIEQIIRCRLMDQVVGGVSDSIQLLRCRLMTMIPDGVLP